MKDTGRMTLNLPEIQNIPVRTKLGRQVRDVFRPEPGRVLVEVDYASEEMRVVKLIKDGLL